ncbi:PalH-domain-containing protein, partial [Cryphonectria parasitica EP155]
LASDCSAVSLPAGGVLDIAGRGTITLTQAAVFTPECTQSSLPVAVANTGILEVQEKASDSTSAFEVRDPFYASTFPQCYALAATTVIAYTLVIMLLITPRSFLDGGVVVLGRGGFTSGGTGGQNIGGRPWLQKMAATFVAVSMTIATVDTFRVAEQQYAGGYQNASVMQADVLGSTELKVIKIISEAFLWLAQAQTLIRLFPRQREKIIIKWTAFALIAFGVLFDSLNSFMYTTAGATRPRSFTDAIPALSYLFQLSLGVLYAAWVVYYSFMKKHYAYYHPQMRNIGLVALLSVTAVLVPIVFFILDICKPDFTSWGDYVRWVGGAAASTIVWEWVERIEALEREEKKDGILGREVFDGDEMLGMSVSEYSWPRKRRNTKRDDDDDDGGESGHATRARAAPTSSDGKSGPWPLVSSIASRYRQRSRSRPRDDGAGAEAGTRGAARGDRGERSGTIRFLQPPLWPTRPPPAATPVSRTDTASAASTVYAVHYQPMADTTTGAAPDARPDSTIGALPAAPSVTPSQSASQVAAGQAAGQTAAHTTNTSTQSGSRLRGLSQATQLFRMPSRGNMTSTEASHKASEPSSQDSSGRRNFKSRFEDFAVTRAERLRERMRPEVDTKALPVRVIPAPPRRGAALQQLRQEQ